MKYLIRPLGSWTDPETPNRRGSHIFKASWRDTLVLLGDEVDKIGAQYPVVFQIDVRETDVRLDGMLRANAQAGHHPGVVVSFVSKFGPLRYATDAYEQQYSGYGLPSWQANIRAIALALEALRAVDRYGVTKRGEQYAGWRALPAGGTATFADVMAAADWMRQYAALTLHLPLGGGEEPDWKGLYRAMARRMHPDRGSPRADWDRLDEARRLLDAQGWL